MTTPEVAVIDFETEAIADRPKYPPVPVGVAIRHKGKSQYLAWGHAVENNTTKSKARDVLRDLYRNAQRVPLLFHNSKFDLEVAEAHLGLRLPPWSQFHDTLLLAFLCDPHSKSLSLKPLATELLKTPPVEQDALRDWILHNVPEARRRPTTWGAYIARAPGKLVGRYAIGDVDRTHGVFKLLHAKLCKFEMQPAYDRERQLLPILLRNEQQGIRIDLRALKRDTAAAEMTLQETDVWLRRKLRVKNPNFNMDSNEELADALEAAGLATGGWLPTDTGQRSTSKQSLANAVEDKALLNAFLYRSALATCFRTFMVPWLELAERNDGTIHTSWNQVRHAGEYGGNGSVGARTGRMSSSPNFMNIPKPFELTPPKGSKLPPLPNMRSYVLPDKGHVFLHRDYNQQELRILAHFEDGDMLGAYQKNPKLDFHDEAKERILEITGVSYERKDVKITNFGLIYGMGAGKLAERLGTDIQAARKLRSAVRTAYPGLRALEDDIRERGRNGEFIRTWGGRIYYSEPPKLINGEMRGFEYKLLNYLIQGSAADCTKQAIINYDEIRHEDARLLATVHDEINASAPAKLAKLEMSQLRDAMESVPFDVPMLSDGKPGKNWADTKGA